MEYPIPNPFPLPTIFNPNYFSTLKDILTIATADSRYIRIGDRIIRNFRLFLDNSIPSLTFQSDQTSGIYYSGLNEIGFCTNSVQRLRITNTFSQFLNSELRVAHTNLVADPKFTLYGNRTVGNQICQSTITQKSTNSSDKALIFRNNTSDLSVSDITYRFQSTGTVDEIQINRRGQLLLTAGTNANPSLSFAGVGDAGLNFASQTIYLSTNATERQRWSDTNGIKFSSGGTNFRNIQFGTILWTTKLSAGAATVIGPFSFPSSFGSNPLVFLQAQPQSGSAWWDRVAYTVASISTTNFTIQIANSSGSDTSSTPGVVIQWFAIGL